MNSKFMDVEKLCKYDLSSSLFEDFDLKIKELIPIRNVYILLTDKGKKILKRIEISNEKLNFIHSGIKYIKRSFQNVMDYYENNSGNIVIKKGNEYYCVIDLIEGRECEFSNPIDLKIATRELSKMHSSSKGFRHFEEECGLNKLVNSFREKKENMELFKNIASMNNENEFNYLFTNNVDYYLNQMEKSIDILQSSKYFELCSEEEKICFCHHDLAYHNILMNDERAYFIDFDYAMIDLRVHDICNYINKVIKYFAYDVQKAVDIINDYSLYSELDEREIKVLYAMLLFPENIYNLTKEFYIRKKTWSEKMFFEKFQKKINAMEDREEFLVKFSHIFSVS